MKKLNAIAAGCVATLAALSMAVPAGAQPWTPSYLHALSDLRSARAYMQTDGQPEFQREKAHVIKEITAAIIEIKSAAVDDGKDIHEDLPTDGRGMASGPLHEATRLLNKAHQDCAEGIDVPSAVGMKLRALKHIDEARDTMERVMHNVKVDEHR